MSGVWRNLSKRTVRFLQSLTQAMNHPAQAVVKTQGAFLPLRVGGADGERILPNGISRFEPLNLSLRKLQKINGAILRFMGRAGVRCVSHYFGVHGKDAGEVIP